MTIVLLVLPDFLVIALGWALLHLLKYQVHFFAAAEKLVYYVLFPALLFSSIVRAPLGFSEASTLIVAALLLMVCGIALAWLAKPALHANPISLGSLAQCAFRFNTYMGLSISLNLAGPEGQGLMAMLVGCTVPLVNIAAVAGMSQRKDRRMVIEVLKNPLIIATVLGLCFNVFELGLPEFIMSTLQRLGACAIALGLMCVGASLSIQGMGAQAKLIGWMLTVRLMILPLLTIGLALILPLSNLEKQMLLLFSTLPTASAAYILAVRMGGDGRSVAVTMSLGTLLSALTIPFWLHVSPF
jgi:Predicted permeases